MVYIALILLAIAMIVGFLGIYTLGLSMATGFYSFWVLVLAGVVFLVIDAYRHYQEDRHLPQ